MVDKVLVPHPMENGHEVVALARTAQGAKVIEVMGTRVALADALNMEELTAAIRRAELDVIIHSTAHP